MGHRQNITKRDDSSVHIGMGYRQNITGHSSVHIGIVQDKISQGTTRAYTLVWVTDKISQGDSSVHIGMGHRQNITRDDSGVHIDGSQTKYHKGDDSSVHIGIVHRQNIIIGIVHDLSQETTRAYTCGMGHRKNITRQNIGHISQATTRVRQNITRDDSSVRTH
ncbi:unnamed protein product [Mytilus edulis]|uniref:Uncharacterized protein n=1 Tax=Mytilus edulis TaxID=6550 RepID=A0A8S3PNR9_MYTED|nr:unnamed protein product [Mytilus edulis]